MFLSPPAGAQMWDWSRNSRFTPGEGPGNHGVWHTPKPFSGPLLVYLLTPIVYLGMVRAGVLETVPGEGTGEEGVGFRLAAAWPPPAAYLTGTPIGVAYYVQKWFRFNLQQWITSRMRELESNEGVYSLEGWQDFQESLIYQ
jgi:hypothetical protein